MNSAQMNSFDLDAECRLAAKRAADRARQRIHIAPLPTPRRNDFDGALWAMTAALTFAVALLAWRLPELLLIGVAV